MTMTKLGSVIAIVGITAALVIGLAFATNDAEQAWRYAGLIIANVAAVVPAILATNKAESVHHDLHNGTLKANIRGAVEELAVDPTVPLVMGTGTYDAESELHSSGVGGGDREEVGA